MGVPGGPLSILRMGEGSKDPYARTGTRLDGHWCNQGVPGRTWGQGGPLPVHRSGRGGDLPTECSKSQIWYTDFQTTPHPPDFKNFCKNFVLFRVNFRPYSSVGNSSESLSLWVLSRRD